MGNQRGSQMVRIALFVAIPLILLVAVAVFISHRAGQDAPIDTTKWESYTDSEYGFSLQYPSNWTLEKQEPENQHVETSYIITDPIKTTAQGTPLPLAQVDISTREYIQLIDRVKADTHASVGETVVIDGVQGSRFRSDEDTTRYPVDATVFPLQERTLIIYTWPNADDANYTQTLSLVLSSLKLQ